MILSVNCFLFLFDRIAGKEGGGVEENNDQTKLAGNEGSGCCQAGCESSAAGIYFGVFLVSLIRKSLLKVSGYLRTI